MEVWRRELGPGREDSLETGDRNTEAATFSIQRMGAISQHCCDLSGQKADGGGDWKELKREGSFDHE